MKKSINLFVPGRLCLFGEHSDWASGYRSINKDICKGYAIVTGINQGIYANVYKSKKMVLIKGDGFFECDSNADKLMNVIKNDYSYFDYLDEFLEFSKKI